MLEKVAPECQDMVLWAQKAGVAMGVRALGKGRVITMGTAMPNVPSGWPELLAWCGVKLPAPATAPDCRVARFVSNNGLYDVYTVWAENVKAEGTVTLTVPGKQAVMLDLLTKRPITGTVVGDTVEFSNLKVEPKETYAFWSLGAK